MKYVLGLFTCSLFISCVALADFTNENISRVKCYVELLGGGTGVYVFSSADSADTPQRVRKEMLGFKVYVENSIEKRIIYKIHECVYMHKEFTMNQAKALENGPM